MPDVPGGDLYGGRARSHVDSDLRFPSSSGALGSWDLGGRWPYLSGLQFSMCKIWIRIHYDDDNGDQQCVTCISFSSLDGTLLLQSKNLYGYLLI